MAETQLSRVQVGFFSRVQVVGFFSFGSGEGFLFVGRETFLGSGEDRGRDEDLVFQRGRGEILKFRYRLVKQEVVVGG